MSPSPRPERIVPFELDGVDVDDRIRWIEPSSSGVTMTPTHELAPIVLEGQYVRLEPLTRAHVKPLFAAATSGSRESFGYTSVAATEAAMSRWVDDALTAQAAGEALPFAVV